MNKEKKKTVGSDAPRASKKSDEKEAMYIAGLSFTLSVAIFFILLGVGLNLFLSIGLTIFAFWALFMLIVIMTM